MCENLELDDRVDWRLEDESSIDAVEVVGSIDQEVVGFRPLSINGVGLAIAKRASRFRQAGRERHNTRLKQAKLREVPSIQWQFEDVAFGNPDLTFGLVQAEVSESYMELQATGWNAGGSNGEGLSRFLAQQVTGGAEGGKPSVAATQVRSLRQSQADRSESCPR